MLRLRFADGDAYAWNKVITSINNLILGKIYIDHGGIMKVRNLGTGLTARIRFKETGMIFDRDPRQVRISVGGEGGRGGVGCAVGAAVLRVLGVEGSKLCGLEEPLLSCRMLPALCSPLSAPPTQPLHKNPPSTLPIPLHP